MTITIRPIQTGCVRIKEAQRHRRGGLPGVLIDKAWTEWLPIYAWVIMHPEGVILVDTGETARTAEPGYFPRWHPYYRLAVQMDVAPEQEIGPQLRRLGIAPDDVRTVVMTHLHTDHAGGLHHLPNSQLLVSGDEHRAAQGVSGKIAGYLPQHWPTWFAPEPITFQPVTVGPFQQSMPVTTASDVIIVPTPGHTPHHVSVIVRGDGVDYFLAGDTSYTEKALMDRQPDGVSPKAQTAVATMDAILTYSRATPTVYLPSHDPASAARLGRQQTIPT